MGSTARITASASRSWAAFALGATAVVLACRAVVASGRFHARPTLMAVAVTSDLTLTTSALAWATLVRAGRASRRALLVVASIGLVAASLLLPIEHRGVARVARLAVPAVELALLGWLGWVTVRTLRALRAAGDEEAAIEDVLRAVAFRTVGRHRGIDAVVTELSLLGMALLSWRSEPHVPSGAIPFTVHRRSGLGAVLLALALASVGEILAVHFLVAHWSTRWAWAATAWSLYALVWLVGDHRAMVLRPVLLDGDMLRVRIGLRWRASIPLQRIQGICAGPDPTRHRGCAVASPIGAPTLYLHLDGPVELQGILGLRRRGACLGLRVDDPGALERAILERRPALRGR